MQEGDTIRIEIDTVNLTGSLDLIGHDGRTYTPEDGAQVLAGRGVDPNIVGDPRLPDDTKLWAALQAVSGGTWGGCVYDVERILEVLDEGQKALGGK